MSHHEITVAHESGKKTIQSYVVGFVLSIMLTLIAFALVEKRLLSNAFLYASLAALAITQLFAQSICFLRLNSSAEGRWNLLPFLLTIFIIAILAIGSLWIMYNLNLHMTN